MEGRREWGQGVVRRLQEGERYLDCFMQAYTVIHMAFFFFFDRGELMV